MHFESLVNVNEQSPNYHKRYLKFYNVFFWKFYKSIDWPIPLANISKKSVICKKYLYEFPKVFFKIYKPIGTFHDYGNNIDWFRKYL